jgi:hypothetical protein
VEQGVVEIDDFIVKYLPAGRASLRSMLATLASGELG